MTGARNDGRHDRFVKRNTSRLYNAATAGSPAYPGKDFNSGFKVMRAEVAAQRRADDVRRAAPLPDRDRALARLPDRRGHACSTTSACTAPSKYGLARFWRGFVDLLTVRFLMTYESRPSHLFSGIGLVSFGARRRWPWPTCSWRSSAASRSAAGRC